MLLSLLKHTHTLHLTLSPTEEEKKMIHYCAHCDYYSNRRSNVLRHQSRKHEMVKEEVVEYPLPMHLEEQPIDRDLVEDSIQVFKIYKLLQRMKNK